MRLPRSTTPLTILARMKRALAAFLLLAVPPTPHAVAAASPEAERQAVREIYQELLEIDTTHSTGSTTIAAEAVAARLLAAGIPADDIARARAVGEARQPRRAPARQRRREAAAPARAPRRGRGQARGLERRPVHAAREGRLLLRRGTLDDKAMAAIFTQALIRMKSRGDDAAARDVILALTADEEGGDENGVEWLLAEHRPLVDAALVLNEGGGGRMRGGKYLVNGVQAAEKTYMDFELVVTQQGRSQLAAGEGERDLPARERAREARAPRVPGRAQRRDARVLRARGAVESPEIAKRHARGREAAARHGGGGAARRAAELQRDAAHDLRRDGARGRPRAERAAAARERERELPHPAGSRRGRGAERDREGARGSRDRGRRSRSARSPGPRPESIPRSSRSSSA